MKNIILPILSIAIVSLTACSTNQDLVGLEEIDDVYYQSGVKLKGNALTASTSEEPSTFMADATEAEQSYYQDMPYVPIEGETQDEQVIDDDENDYYDEDYARRLDNFHSTELKEDYIYDNEYGYDTYEEIPNATSPYYNTNPQVNWNIMYSSYNPGMNWGLSFGSPGYSPPPFGLPNQAYRFACYPNPYYNNYCNCPYYGGYNSFYSPYAYSGYGYGSPYYGGNSQYYNYGYDNSNQRYVVNDQRGSSGRISRGGLIQPPSNNGVPDGHGLVSAPSSTERWGQTTRTTSKNTAFKGSTRSGSGLQSQSNLIKSLRPRSAGISSTTRTSRSSISPYTRSQQSRSSTSRSQSSNKLPSYMNRSSSNNRSNSIGNSTRPNNNTRNTPSYTPSRSSSGSGSSPSRSSSPTRRR